VKVSPPPPISSPSPRPSGLLVVRVDVARADEEELNRWYEEEHLPERLAVPGIRAATRYRSVEVPGRYLALYETDDPGLPLSEAYMRRAPTAWGIRVMARWTGMDRSVWERI